MCLLPEQRRKPRYVNPCGSPVIRRNSYSLSRGGALEARSRRIGSGTNGPLDKVLLSASLQSISTTWSLASYQRSLNTGPQDKSTPYVLAYIMRSFPFVSV
eukprot:Blabericola_migrator_1__5384@NODE_2758_length_2383_cov_47_316926_g1726_i0_p2_GENE_NODE_2758_length_2383_cov_47_316926_g1726_i0NODE_2758_length_2383_cov_47_316926_g1726_i0_p2_ORF_typecomplete_len101_score1_39XKrelated/PF09815_9/0_0049_NODE_2758_length_2383_cov_47_316926_g1726_i017922094